MFRAIWYYLYNLKNVKNTHGGVLLLVALLHGCFLRFLNCTNVTKSRNTSQITFSTHRTRINLIPENKIWEGNIRIKILNLGKKDVLSKSS